MMHSSCVLLAVVCVLVAPAFAQEAPPAPLPTAPETPAPTEAAEAQEWSFGVSVYTWFVPDDREYVSPTITADRGWQHFELRYNYESIDTVSAWLGGNLSFGEEELTLELTPMLGVVFGSNTNGIAPGYKATLGWRQFEFYSEGEYLFDADVHSESFFYNWSELTFAPVETFKFGVVTQRTRLYESDNDTQRGVLVGIQGETWNVTGYLFDPDESKPTFVLSLGVGF